MPLRFEAAHGSAVDSRNDLKIFRSRMEPTSTPEEVEYQYAIYRGETQYGFGCLGLSTVVQEQGRPVRVISEAGSSAMLFWAISALPAAINACPQRISMLPSLC